MSSHAGLRRKSDDVAAVRVLNGSRIRRLMILFIMQPGCSYAAKRASSNDSYSSSAKAHQKIIQYYPWLDKSLIHMMAIWMCHVVDDEVTGRVQDEN